MSTLRSEKSLALALAAPHPRGVAGLGAGPCWRGVMGIQGIERQCFMWNRNQGYRSSGNALATLDNDRLHAIAPSVFAENPHESRSSRYAFIPTIRVVDGLRGAGFQPVWAAQSKCRTDLTRQDFTKHMIRFRHVDALDMASGTFPEVVMVNSHDGTSTYQFLAGLFRMVCGNGLICGDFEALKIQHTGRIVKEAIAGSYGVLEQSRRSLGVAQDWQQLQLTSGEQSALAVAAHHVRFADSQGNVDTPIQPAQLLRARRVDDMKNDLWTTFNRIQENTIRGGLRGVGQDSQGRRRRVSTREVRGIDGNLNLNKALWKLAEALAASKHAPIEVQAA